MTRQKVTSYGGETRARDGITAILINTETGAENTFALAGSSSRRGIDVSFTDLVREVCARCDALGPEWKVKVLSSPSSILADLRNHGQEVPIPQTQHESVRHARIGRFSYEERVLCLVGRQDLAIVPAWASVFGATA